LDLMKEYEVLSEAANQALDGDVRALHKLREEKAI